jgi:hypothetical protein
MPLKSESEKELKFEQNVKCKIENVRLIAEQ